MVWEFHEEEVISENKLPFILSTALPLYKSQFAKMKLRYSWKGNSGLQCTAMNNRERLKG